MSDPPKRRGRRLRDEERTLWRNVTRSVTPMRPVADDDEIDTTAPNIEIAPSPRAAPRPVARPAAPAPSPPPLAPLGRRYRQKLVRGSEPVDGKLDLHGKRQTDAYAVLGRFLHRAQASGFKLVLVITGKGRRGHESEGVLRRQVPLWLAQPEFRSYVVGFEEAHIAHGGEGALYVRLRRARG